MGVSVTAYAPIGNPGFTKDESLHTNEHIK